MSWWYWVNHPGYTCNEQIAYNGQRGLKCEKPAGHRGAHTSNAVSWTRP